MELGEGFKLCSGLCIGARAGREKHELLLSFDVGTVQIYDVSDTRSHHSLTSSHNSLALYRLFLTAVVVVGSFHQISASALRQSTTLHQIATGLYTATGGHTHPIRPYVTCTSAHSITMTVMVRSSL